MLLEDIHKSQRPRSVKWGKQGMKFRVVDRLMCDTRVDGRAGKDEEQWVRTDRQKEPGQLDRWADGQLRWVAGR